MQTLVEIGPSNSSQGQHRRKDATEQMKNEKTLGSSPSECQIFHLFRCVCFFCAAHAKRWKDKDVSLSQ